jgi:hypothetical protein
MNGVQQVFSAVNLSYRLGQNILNSVLRRDNLFFLGNPWEKDGEDQLDRSCEKRKVLLRVNERRNILHEINKRKVNWIGQILRNSA